MPRTACAISPSTLATARVTPLPCQRSPPSRSSVASNSPVEAPEGTAARPEAPERRTMRTSTVGLPRLSRIWRAWTRSIWLIGGGGTRLTSPASPGGDYLVVVVVVGVDVDPVLVCGTAVPVEVEL